MKGIKLTLLIYGLCLGSNMAWSQYDIEEAKSDSTEQKELKVDRSALKEKIMVGSGLNLSFWNSLFFYISPRVGYEVLPNLNAGICTMYQLQRYGSSGSYYNINSFGGGLFVRYRPFKPVFVETSINQYSIRATGYEPISSNAWMLGLGYANSFTDKSYLSVMVQYNFLEDVNVPGTSYHWF